MARVGDARNARHARRQPGEEAADRHVAVHQVRPLAPQQGDEGAEGPPLCNRRHPSDERRWLDAEAFRADVGKQRPVRGDPDHLVPAFPDAAHERQDEMAQ